MYVYKECLQRSLQTDKSRNAKFGNKSRLLSFPLRKKTDSGSKHCVYFKTMTGALGKTKGLKGKLGTGGLRELNSSVLKIPLAILLHVVLVVSNFLITHRDQFWWPYVYMESHHSGVFPTPQWPLFLS